MKKTLFTLLSISVLGSGVSGFAFSEDNIMTLNHRQQALAAIGAFTAADNQAELKTTLNHAFEQGLTVNEAKDAMVQLYAYTGFPRSLNALSTLSETVKDRQEKGLKTEQGRVKTALPKDTDILWLGTKTQTNLVGQAVDLSALSSDIDRYLKTHLFGDIFASDLLNWQEREIVTIGALNQLNVPNQLSAHIEIGKKNGLTDMQINEITKISVQKMEKLSQFPMGKSNDDYAQYFTGQSYLAPGCITSLLSQRFAIIGISTTPQKGADRF